jgi:hypothetical protein
MLARAPEPSEPAVGSNRYCLQRSRRDREVSMMTKLRDRLTRQHGKVGWILLWLLGVPIPVLLVLFLLRGCT